MKTYTIRWRKGPIPNTIRLNHDDKGYADYHWAAGTVQPPPSSGGSSPQSGRPMWGFFRRVLRGGQQGTGDD